MRRAFERFASWVAWATGTAVAFALALAVVVAWAGSGPVFGFSDTWQLIINTATTISTGLLVFIIQHTQNRDQAAIQAKLDELIRAIDKADDRLIGIEKEV